MCSFFLLPEGAFQNHSRLRTPPLPLSHSHSPSHQHHAASINSLNRSNYTQRSNPSPAPTDSSVPPEGPASQDSVSVQDNWLLNSNIPLETRYLLVCVTECCIEMKGWLSIYLSISPASFDRTYSMLWLAHTPKQEFKSRKWKPVPQCPSFWKDKVEIATRGLSRKRTTLNNHSADNELDYEQTMSTVLWKIRQKLRFWP